MSKTSKSKLPTYLLYQINGDDFFKALDNLYGGSEITPLKYFWELMDPDQSTDTLEAAMELTKITKPVSDIVGKIAHVVFGDRKIIPYGHYRIDDQKDHFEPLDQIDQALGGIGSKLLGEESGRYWLDHIFVLDQEFIENENGLVKSFLYLRYRWVFANESKE